MFIAGNDKLKEKEKFLCRESNEGPARDGREHYTIFGHLFLIKNYSFLRRKFQPYKNSRKRMTLYLFSSSNFIPS